LENIGKEVILADRGVVPSFACRNWQKTWKTPIRIDDDPAKIQTRSLSDTGLENSCYTYPCSESCQAVNRSSANQECPCILWNLNIYHYNSRACHCIVLSISTGGIIISSSHNIAHWFPLHACLWIHI
jgi:hypothetical protein